MKDPSLGDQMVGFLAGAAWKKRTQIIQIESQGVE